MTDIRWGPKLRMERHEGVSNPGTPIAEFDDDKGGRGRIFLGEDALMVIFANDPPGVAWRVQMRDVVSCVSMIKRRRK